MESIYNHIDVSIVPSLVDDSFPTTILESMYFKKPVIGTYIGGIPEMIESGRNGFTFTPNNASELSEHIAFFIQNPEKIEVMGKIGQEIFNKKFTLEIFNKNYMHFISNLFKSQSI
ncbi:glycosyltransferase [Phocaeicola coprophilus]|uniref:glycosyltransferase n=1 Tax=Phocaeicola coprophilus TaxID=387090 RepID=UPI0039951A4A